MRIDPDSRAEDAEMVRLTLEGDPLAYRGLVEKYQERLYHLCFGMLRNREDAIDVAQEAFVKAHQNLATFRVESTFYTWLYRIARNLVVDHVRRKRRKAEVAFDDAVAARDEEGEIAAIHEADGPGRLTDRAEVGRKVMEALQHLPEDQREVVLLREVEEMSYKEIAEAMDIPEGTVMSRLFYARRKLQQLLTAQGIRPLE
jgi:RNA polymerase sigma-70 factor (ECF subfamily)